MENQKGTPESFDVFKTRGFQKIDKAVNQSTEVGGAFEFHCLGSEEHPRNKHLDSVYYLSKIDQIFLCEPGADTLGLPGRPEEICLYG